MQRDELLQKLEQLIPEIQDSRDAAGTLLKFAAANNLSPAQLEALAQVYNTGKALTFYEKSASRGGSFSLVSTEDLLEQYTAYKPATAAVKSAAATSTAMRAFPHHASLNSALEKAAALEEEVTSLAYQATVITRDIEATKQAKEMVREAIDEKLDEARSALEGIRQAVRFNKKAFAALERDATYLLETDPSVAITKIADYLGNNHCDVSEFRADLSDPPALVRDTTGLVDKVACIADALGFVKAATLYLEDMEKEASPSLADLMPPTHVFSNMGTPTKKQPKKPTTGPSRNPSEDPAKNPEDNPDNSESTDNRANPDTPPTGKTPRSGGPPARNVRTFSVDYDDDPEGSNATYDDGSNLDGVLEKLIKGMSAPTYKSKGVKKPLQTGMELVTALHSGKNVRQQKRDNAVQDDTGVASLQRLMISDPVLAEADPNEVLGHYNTINEIAPAVAADPAKLRLPLREAVQYGSIPMHTLKELLEINKLIASNKEQMAKNDSAAYEVKAKAPFATTSK